MRSAAVFAGFARAMRPRVILPTLAALLLAACGGGASIHYHTLMAPADAEPVAVGSTTFVLSDIQLPPQVDVPELVIRHGEGRSKRLENDLWAGPLRDEMKNAISTRLRSAHGLRDMDSLTARPPDGSWQIRLAVRRLEVWPGDHVRLEADWRLSGVQTVPFCSFQEQKSVGKSTDEAVLTLQSLVRDLADSIAQSLQSPDSCKA